MRKIILLISVIFLINLVSADIGFNLKPLDASNNTIPNTAFTYKFDLTANINCSNILLSYNETIVTLPDGTSFISFDISNLSQQPLRLCIYRDGSLILNTSYLDLILNSLRVNNITVNGNSLVKGISYLEDLTKKSLSASVSSQELYVDLTSGNDTTGNGSTTAPYLTVQKAVDSLPRVITKDTNISISNGNVNEAGVDTSGLIITASLTFQAKDTSGNKLYDDGTATGGSTSTLQDTGKTWAINIFTSGKIFIWSGTGRGQIADIVSNNGNTITISGTWTTPDTSSQYTIVSPVQFTTANPDYVFLLIGMKNTNIYGFQFTETGSVYSVSYSGKSAYGQVMWNYFKGNDSRNILVDGQSDVGIYMNYFTVPTTKQGIVVTGSSISIPRGNVFKAYTSGNGTGLYVYRLGVTTIGSGTSGSYETHNNIFTNLNIGAESPTTATAGQIEGLSHNTYVNCTTNYTSGDMNIGSINGLDINNFGIGTTTPLYPLHVAVNTSQANQSISAFFQGNITATGFITRTNVYDKTKGTALDKIKDANAYFNLDGTINHSAFYGYIGGIKDIDYSRPEIKENCDIQSIDKNKQVCKNVTIYPYTKIVEGVELGAEVSMLEQAIYELKTENNRIKQCTSDSKTWVDYQKCVNG